MKKYLLTLLFLVGFLAWSQPPGGERKGHSEPEGEIFGVLTDSLTNQPISYATILAIKQPENKTIGGVVTDENGAFSIQKLEIGTYQLKISFVGFETRFVDGITLTESKTSHQLKDLYLAPSTLQTVEVIGNTPEITYEIDKKVVNVEDMQNTAGQTALEVLENVPSIIVNPDGTVTLRGSSSFTLLIDGVPSILDPSDALSQIPASTIQDIEIITNPSAKFDAEGTSGVINVITKKNKLQGMSCLINASGGLFGNYNADGAYSIRKNKIAFDVNANIRQRTRPSDQFTRRETIYDSLTNVLSSEGISDRIFGGYGGGFGFQWTPNSGHKMVLKSNINSRDMSFLGDHDFENYDDDSLINAFRTRDMTLVDMWNSSSSIFYQHNIKRNKNHYISLKAIANLKYVDQVDSTLSYDENDNLFAGNLYTELGPSNMYRFNLDYKLPVKEHYKFETGAQAQFGRSFDDGDSYSYNDSTGLYELLPLFSSDVDYIRDVHAAYAIFGGQLKQFGFQTGMRMEYTFRKVTSQNFPQSTTIRRPDWFPSVHLSYSFENKAQLLLSYSRRITRPRSWFFEPFITWESPFSVRSGNPNLEPTYNTVIDFSFMKPIKQKGFYSFEGYYRRSDGTLQWIQTTYEPGILIKQPYNIGVSQRIGLEGSVNYNFVKWYQLNAGFNAYLFDLDGSIEGADFSTNSFNYNFNLRNTFNFNDWIIQLNGRYRSGSVEPQGEKLWEITGDVSLKKSFYKNKLTFNLNARNAFLSARNISYIYTENVTVLSEGYPWGPMISLTVTLKLNNYEKIYKEENLDDF